MSDPAIERLLGPRGPEIGCDECFERLDEFVELDLERGVADAEAAVPGMRAHLGGCPACREEYESLRALVDSDLR
jgi:predicted anti-sigma-YlaC factor YlaD